MAVTPSHDSGGISFFEEEDDDASASPRDTAYPAAVDEGDGARHASVLGAGRGNWLGDLHALQQLCDRQARGVRGVFEPLLKRQPRIVAEPLTVERFDDYLDRLKPGLASFNILRMAPLNGHAMIAMEAGLVLSMVDLFFGGTGAAPQTTPSEFTIAEDAIIRRAVAGIVEVLNRTWVELAEVSFHPHAAENNRRMLSHLDGEDPVIVCRFELTMPDGRTSPVDLVYPVVALKPLASVLCAKVQSKRADSVDPAWRSGLTRAVMNVPIAVRSVLAEPTVKLSQLMALQPGDIIPIELGPDIPLLVTGARFAHGTVGQANGRAAVRIDRLERLEDEDHR